MDLSSPFKSEVFRPITVLLIPGLIAGFPYQLIAGHYFPDLQQYRDEHEIIYFTTIALIVIGIGYILQDLGTELELRIDDYLIKTRHPDLYDVWYEYLGLKLAVEPIGQRYLRTVLLRLKFELSTAVALIVCYAGLVWLSLLRGLFSALSLGLLGLSFLLLTIFLTYQAYQGADVLANVRRILVGKPPIA